MNLDPLHRRLIEEARKHAPANDVPYAFEKRVMARLAGTPCSDEWAQWIRALWSGAAVCAAVAIAAGVWSFTPNDEQELAAHFSTDLEQTILAADAAESTW